MLDNNAALRGDNFQSHNQKIAWTPNGLFRSGDLQADTNGSDNVVVQRSTDHSATWQNIFDTGVHRDNLKPPTIEAGPAGNVYIIYPNSGGTRFVKFSPSNNYGSAVVNKLSTAASSGSKFASCHDPGRNRIYHATQWGSVLTFDTSGNVTRNQQLIKSGGDSRPSYPHLFVDESGVIHYAMTVADNGDDVPYTDIRYLKSLDGGQSWKAMNGTPVSIPTAAAGASSAATLINRPDEHNYKTWLACMHAKNGKVHFVYQTGNPWDPAGAGNPPAITPYMNYMRFDLASGAREIDRTSLGGPDLAINAESASFASIIDHPDSPLYVVGEGPNGHRLLALVSDDNGQTWQDYARSDWHNIIANPGLARDVTPDGEIIGGVALSDPFWATVNFFSLPAVNNPPEVEAGADGTADFPLRSTGLNATVTDDGVTPLTTTWSKVSGPGSVSFGDAGAVDTVAIFSQPGAYVLRLTADDGDSQVSDEVQVTVDEEISASGYPGECGTVQARVYGGDDWHKVAFRQNYTNPVLVMGPPSFGGSEPVTIRVRNVTASGFEFQLDEWNYLDGSHGFETIGYLVFEAGDHTLDDGTRIQAGTVSVDHNFGSVSFPSAFAAAPAVLVQTSTRNGASAVTERLKSIAAAGFEVRVQEEEGQDGDHAVETVGWIAVEEGAGTTDGLLFEAAVTAQDVSEEDKNIVFSQAFASAPVFLASMQTFAGTDPCALRHKTLNKDGATVFVEEEQSANDEVDHANERVGYLAIDQGLFGGDRVTGTLRFQDGATLFAGGAVWSGTEDTAIRSDAVNNNYGTAGALQLRDRTIDDDGLFRFDLSSLPPEITVESVISATLNLTTDSATAEGANTFELFMVDTNDSGWIEGAQAGAQPPVGTGATYSHEVHDTTGWDGGGRSPVGRMNGDTPISSVTFSSLPAAGDKVDFVFSDPAEMALIKSWIEGGANGGFLVLGRGRDTGAGDGTVWTVRSSEHATAADRPMLTLAVAFAPAPVYDAWADAHAGGEGPELDFNRNGVPNGIEYFMGGTLASPASLPALVDAGSAWTWTIPYDTEATGLTWTFQVSEDLVNWTDYDETDTDEVTVESSPDQIILTLPAGGTGRQFARLVVLISQ